MRPDLSIIWYIKTQPVVNAVAVAFIRIDLVLSRLIFGGIKLCEVLRGALPCLDLYHLVHGTSVCLLLNRVECDFQIKVFRVNTSIANQCRIELFDVRKCHFIAMAFQIQLAITRQFYLFLSNSSCKR